MGQLLDEVHTSTGKRLEVVWWQPGQLLLVEHQEYWLKEFPTMVPEDEEIPCFLVKFSFLLILRIIKWPVPSNMVIKGNFANVRCRTGSPVLLRTPYLLLIHPAALTCECRICTGVQSSLQGLLLLALNDSAETDPLRSLHRAWCRLTRHWLCCSQWGGVFQYVISSQYWQAQQWCVTSKADLP